jgi:DNA-binding SARP family transcriptional activator/predicted negative regulator of RcsB-dependent stress response
LSSLHILLLGPPRIEREGAALDVDTRKAIALLAYLAASESGAHSRDSLAALFWPDVDHVRANAALRRTLSVLNKALAGEWLEIEREAVNLPRRAGLFVDLDRFAACLSACRQHPHPAHEVCPACLPLLAEAAGLYRDDFMAGFSLRDSPAFDDWQFFQAEGLRRQLASVLDRLSGGHAHSGDFEAALEHARRWLALDTLHEPAHQRLMQLYAWSGQRAAALRQYRDCVRVLEQELDVAPLDETTELYAAIRENRAPAPPQAPRAAQAARSTGSEPAAEPAMAAIQPPAQVHAAVLPLVGRQAAWQALSDAYRAASREGRLVVVEGEAGIGKTRLAEAFLQQAIAGGARGVIARCYEGEQGLAYEPIAAALRAALDPAPPGDLDPRWLSEAARLLPELHARRPELPPVEALDSPGAQARFFEGVRAALLASLSSGTRSPGLIVFDDAQWLDAASLDMLTYIVRRLPEPPVYLLLNWRSESVPAGHRLRQLLADAQRAGLATSISLERLDLEAVIELARQALPADRPAGSGRDIARRLYQETEGLPFFVVEYLTALTQSSQHGDLAWSLPGSARGLLEARLASVSQTGRQLLHAAAVIGRSFDFDTLQSASGRSDEETVAGLEDLMASGLVLEVASPAEGGLAGRMAAPSYDFTHEKLRGLVYEQTSLARRRLLHRRVAEALSARPRRPGGGPASQAAGQIAYHYQLAGREAEAAEFYQQAGDHARSLYANAEALAHYQSALALGHPATSSLHEAIGDLLTLQGDYDGALNSYETAAAQSEPAGLPALEHKLGAIYHRLGNWELAESHFQAALEALGDEPTGARARVCADWSLTAHQAGQPERAEELASQALALAEQAGDRRALAQAHNLLGILAGSHGHAEQAHSHLEHSLALADELDDPEARAAALNNLALAHAAAGEFEAALASARQALALCVARGDRHREAALHSNIADLLHATGQADAAMQHLKQSAAIYAEIGTQAGDWQPEVWKLAEW